MQISFANLINGILAIFSSYPAPGPCTGDCWAHDPALYQRESDANYFRFSSGHGIHIHRSDSITGPWKGIGEALPNGSVINHPGRNKLWAPDIHYEPADQKYYMYYSVSTRGSHDSVIGVASSPDLTPESWTDHGAILHSTKKSPYNAIDANWISINDKPYLNFGSYWDGLFQVPLQSPLKVADSEGKDNDEVELRRLAYNSTANHHIEASSMVQRDGWYYLFFSSGRASRYEKEMPAQGEEYRIVVCRSRSGKGDFVDRDGKTCLESGGTTVLSSHANIYGPGGQGVVEDKEHGFVLYYHYADTTKRMSFHDYQFGWNVLKWSDGWPVL
ncbi:glycosyl hydrolase [Aspergillus aurantiobrunneus]